MGTRNSLIVFAEHSSSREASRTDILFGFPEDRISKIYALSAGQLIINPYEYRYVKTFESGYSYLPIGKAADSLSRGCFHCGTQVR